MARIVTQAGGLPGKRPRLFLAFTPGDTPTLEIVIEGVPFATAVLSEAWLTFKNSEGDADPGVLQLSTAVGAQGSVVDTGSDGVGLVRFTPTAVQTALLVAATLYFDLQVALSDGKVYTVARGHFRPWRPPVNAWEGSRGNTGLIRNPITEPVEGQPWPYENELLDDVVAGDDYAFRRLVYGLAAGRTVVSARFTMRSTPEQADPGLFQLAITSVSGAAGKIEDTGSGAPRRADLRFAFTQVQTALLAVARGWDVEVTLDNGEIHTVLRGTALAAAQVTLAVPVGGGIGGGGFDSGFDSGFG